MHRCARVSHADHGKQGLLIVLILLYCFFLFLLTITSTLLRFLQSPSIQSEWCAIAHCFNRKMPTRHRQKNELTKGHHQPSRHIITRRVAYFGRHATCLSSAKTGLPRPSLKVPSCNAQRGQNNGKNVTLELLGLASADLLSLLLSPLIRCLLRAFSAFFAASCNSPIA